jgi:putative inorganic carbon (hco3(-)) transporter
MRAGRFANSFLHEEHMKSGLMSGSVHSVVDGNNERPWAANTPFANYHSVPELIEPKTQPDSAQPRWNLAFAGLMIYIFVEYSRLPEMYPVLTVLKLGKISILLAALGYLVSPRSRTSGRLASRSFDLAILVFIISSLLSACFASEQQYVWDGFLDVLGWGMVYFLITRVLTSSWRIRIFGFLILLLNLKFAQHTVREYVFFRSIGMSDMRIITGGGAGEGSSSFFGNVADLGLAMVVVWGIVWALLVGKTEKRKLARVFLMICFALFLLAILLCGSRGAVVGAAAIMLTALARSPKKIGAVVLAVIFVLSIWFVLPGASKERFSSAWDWQNDPNSASRVTFWKTGLRMFEENPIFGVGPGNFSQINAGHRAAHSLYIQALAESGLVGSIAIATLWILFFRMNARTRKHALATDPDGRRSFEYCLAFGLNLALVGYLTSGAFLSVLYYPHLWILLGLSAAVNRCSANKQPKELAVENRRLRNFTLAAS